MRMGRAIRSDREEKIARKIPSRSNPQPKMEICVVMDEKYVYLISLK